MEAVNKSKVPGKHIMAMIMAKFKDLRRQVHHHCSSSAQLRLESFKPVSEVLRSAHHLISSVAKAIILHFGSIFIDIFSHKLGLVLSTKLCRLPTAARY
jgi:hypothetical protein